MNLDLNKYLHRLEGVEVSHERKIGALARMLPFVEYWVDHGFGLNVHQQAVDEAQATLPRRTTGAIESRNQTLTKTYNYASKGKRRKRKE